MITFTPVDKVWQIISDKLERIFNMQMLGDIHNEKPLGPTPGLKVLFIVGIILMALANTLPPMNNGAFGKMD